MRPNAGGETASTEWGALVGELDQWEREGRIATFWWRDDDATEATDELRRMMALLVRYRAPLHIAVIPGRMQPDLPNMLRHDEDIGVLQHGYSHARGELYWLRDGGIVLEELRLGRDILAAAMGDVFMPVLVPPWNRIRDEYLPLVASAGFKAVSGHGRRRRHRPEFLELNVHSGPLVWDSEGGRFGGVEAPLRSIVRHLLSRRIGECDGDEPTGYCTHHRNLDPGAWEFSHTLLDLTTNHPAARWISLREVLDGDIWR